MKQNKNWCSEPEQEADDPSVGTGRLENGVEARRGREKRTAGVDLWGRSLQASLGTVGCCR